jgi:hypothetical protein
MERVRDSGCGVLLRKEDKIRDGGKVTNLNRNRPASDQLRSRYQRISVPSTTLEVRLGDCLLFLDFAPMGMCAILTDSSQQSHISNTVGRFTLTPATRARISSAINLRLRPPPRKMQIERAPQHSSTLVERTLSPGVPLPQVSYIALTRKRGQNIPLSSPCQSLRIPRAGRISRKYHGLSCRFCGRNTVARSEY